MNKGKQNIIQANEKLGYKIQSKCEWSKSIGFIQDNKRKTSRYTRDGDHNKDIPLSSIW